MYRTARLGLIVAVAAAFAAPAMAQTSIAARAFEPYEAIRTALASDTLDGVADHATQLIPLATELAGDDAKKASERLSKATTIKAAREAFGALSKILVPKLREARLPDVHAFECPMVKLPWAQRGDKLQNPYLGKAMPTCGNPIKDKL